MNDVSAGPCVSSAVFSAQYSGKFQMILAQPRLDLKLSAPDFMLLHLALHGCRPDPDDMNFVKVLQTLHASVSWKRAFFVGLK